MQTSPVPQTQLNKAPCLAHATKTFAGVDDAGNQAPDALPNRNWVHRGNASADLTGSTYCSHHTAAGLTASLCCLYGSNLINAGCALLVLIAS